MRETCPGFCPGCAPGDMRLLVFLHGTVLMHAGGVGVTRAERVAQMRAKHPTSSSRTTAKHRCRPGHLPADTVHRCGPGSEAMLAVGAFGVAPFHVAEVGQAKISGTRRLGCEVTPFVVPTGVRGCVR